MQTSLSLILMLSFELFSFGLFLLSNSNELILFYFGTIYFIIKNFQTTLFACIKFSKINQKMAHDVRMGSMRNPHPLLTGLQI